MLAATIHFPMRMFVVSELRASSWKVVAANKVYNFVEESGRKPWKQRRIPCSGKCTDTPGRPRVWKTEHGRYVTEQILIYWRFGGVTGLDMKVSKSQRVR